MKKNKAFTLIELLVVISIIGLLASIVLISLRGVRAKAKDARRLSDMSQIVLALEMYYDTYGQFPDNAQDGVCGDWDDSSADEAPADGNLFIDALIDEGLFAKVPSLL